MNKRNRIKKNSDFQAVFNKKQSFANRQFVIYIRKKENQSTFRIGLSVSKKIGNAVTRNRIKRYIRQAFLEYKEEIKPNLDIVVIARKPTANMDFHETKSSLTHVLKNIGAFNQTGNKGRSH